MFPQTPALLLSSLTVLGLPGTTEMISSGPSAMLGFPLGWLGEIPGHRRSLGNLFPLLLWDFVALVLLEHLVYRENGWTFVEQRVQCLSSDLNSVWKWEIIPRVVAVLKPKAVALRG